jgi:Holliday junction DNA helicase RuvB
MFCYMSSRTGETTLSSVIANEMEVAKRLQVGGDRKSRDLASILTNLQENDILFIDEIHRLNTVVEEVLYRRWRILFLILSLGRGLRSFGTSGSAKFTIIGATTRIGLLSSPLRDRFGLVHRLEFYDSDDIQRIVERSAKILGLELIEWEPRNCNAI